MNKDNIEIKNLSEEEGSALNAIVNWWQTYDFFDKNTNDIYNDLIMIIPHDKLLDLEVQNLLDKIIKITDVEKAAVIIGNFVLRGDHLGQLHGFKEVSAKYRKSKR